MADDFDADERKALTRLYAFRWVAACHLGFPDRPYASRVLQRLKRRGLAKSGSAKLWSITDDGRRIAEALHG